jgi:hypothetical protein
MRRARMLGAGNGLGLLLRAEIDGAIKQRGTQYANLVLIVDVPVPAEPPLEVIMKSDRATRDQVTGLRFVGS